MDVPKKTEMTNYVNYPKSYIIGLIIGVIIFIPSVIIGSMHQLSGFQASIFYYFNNLPNYLDTPTYLVTEILAIYAIPLCILISLLYKKFRLAWRFFVVVGGAGLVTEIIKHIVKEPRPVHLLNGHIHARVAETGYTSFPSGHVTVAVAMALIVWTILPKKWRWVSILWILLVAFSRLYLGAHTPNDLVGAFAVGLISVCVVRLLPYNFAKILKLDTKVPLLSRIW
jgi:membrane-associated phospholipid phosphatase